MIRIDEYTNYYLYCIYEHGEFKHACCKLELKITDRQKARDIITSYINKFCEIKDNKHPLLNLTPLQARQLIELLEQDIKGIRQNNSSDLPSVW